MEMTIFEAFTKVTLDSVVSGVAGNLTYEVLKSLGGSFIDTLKKYFQNETQAEEFFKEVSTSNARNAHKPVRDIEDAYETIVNKSLPENFIKEFESWIESNKMELLNMAGQQIVQGQFVAGRDVNIVKGQQFIINR